MEPQHDNYAQKQNTSLLASLSHRLVPISKHEMYRLLSKGSERLRNRESEATAILSRLEELNLDVAKHFRPKQDALSQLDFRLITTKVPELGTFPSFIAVSYCWHSPDWIPVSAAEPIVDGWKISKPMVDALIGPNGIRASEEEGIWLDQLCINQNDDMDKKIHVGAMDMIYRSCRRMVILLEDIQLTEDEERAGRAYATFYQELCEEVKKRNLTERAQEDFVEGFFSQKEKEYRDRGEFHKLATVGSFAHNLLGARWFSRAWCAHESHMAPYQSSNQPIFLCYGYDGEVVSFEFCFIHCLSYHVSFVIPEKEQQMIGANFQHLMNEPVPTTLQQRSWRLHRLKALERPNLSPMQQLVNILPAGCSKKGDLISIGLNTSDIPMYYEGNLTTVEDVIWVFSLLVLATGDIVPLLAKGSKLRLTDGDESKKETISWAIRPHQTIQNQRFPITDSSLITGATRDYIELDLLIFKSLPSTPSAESLDLASRIIEQHRLTDLAREFFVAADLEVRRVVETIGYNPGSDTRGFFTNFHQVMLAQAIDCGPEWILRLPRVLEMETGPKWMFGPMGVASDPRLTGAACTLLSQFPPSCEKDNPTAIQHQLSIIIRFFRCLLDPRLVLLCVLPRRLPAGSGDFAVTQPVSCRSYIAVPAAVAHVPHWEERAWIIEPFDENSSPYTNCTSDYGDTREFPDEQRSAWQLRMRQVIYGCQPLTADNVSVVLRKKQRVYGAEDYIWGERPTSA